MLYIYIIEVIAKYEILAMIHVITHFTSRFKVLNGSCHRTTEFMSLYWFVTITDENNRPDSLDFEPSSEVSYGLKNLQNKIGSNITQFVFSISLVYLMLLLFLWHVFHRRLTCGVIFSSYFLRGWGWVVIYIFHIFSCVVLHNELIEFIFLYSIY